MISITAQTRPRTHQRMLPVNDNTLRFLINQWQTSIREIITVIFIIVSVGSKAAPPFTSVNIDDKMLQAVVKSGERKNTHVTFTRKNVSSASSNFEDCK